MINVLEELKTKLIILTFEINRFWNWKMQLIITNSVNGFNSIDTAEEKISEVKAKLGGKNPD